MIYQNDGLDQLKINEFGEVLHGYLIRYDVLESLLRAVMLQNRAQLGLGVIIIQ